jgi:microcystin-dependent protein
MAERLCWGHFFGMSAQPEYFITPRIPGVRPKDPPDYDGYVFVYVFTRILDPWVVPPVANNVDVIVDNSQGFVPGMTIAVEAAGYYQVVQTTALNRMTIENLPNANNAPAGTTIPPGNLTTTSLPGPKGDQGIQGIPGVAATVDAGTTTTGPAGQNASVVNVGTQSQAVFNFTIPRGPTGPQGPQGAPGQAYNNTTTAAFTAADAPTVQNLSLQSTTGLFTGVVLDINPIGYYQVQNVISSTQVSVVNTMTPGNSAAGTVSPSGSAVLGTGPQGPAGIPASITAGNTTTLAPGNPAAVTQRGTSTAAIFDFAIPQGALGAPGATGAQGPPGTNGVDGVSPTVNAGTTATLSPGQPAAVTQRGTPTAVIFDFAIPQGAVGATGPAGATGPTGPTGAAGTAATVAAGTTNTGLPGTNAAVTNSGSTSAAVFNFTIPRGDVGAVGPAGPQGATGPQGPAGPVGAVGNEDVGSIKAWPAAAAPASWLLADGSAVSRTLYPALFTVIGTNYGAGDGSTTFNLPDMRGRFVLGFGQGAGLANRVLAAVGGEENHQLITAELAAHTHLQNAHQHALPANINMAAATFAAGATNTLFAPPAGATWMANTSPMTPTNQNTGGDGGHNNMPPFLVITYIIKVSPTGGATAQAPIADTTQDGLLRKVSGLTTDFVDGTNNCRDHATAIQPTIWSARLRSFNAIGNPTFEVDQRRAGASVGLPSGTAFSLDRWYGATSGTLRIGTQQGAGAVTVPGTSFAISGSNLGVVVSTQQAVLGATDYFFLGHTVEGSIFRELSLDVSSISILAYCTVPLKFGLMLRELPGAAHSLVKLCTIPTGGQWTLITLPNLPVFTASGTFPITPGHAGYEFGICLAAGSTYIAPAANIWQTGNFLGAPGMDNFGALAVNTTFALAFIQHEPGPICTTPIDKPFQQNYDECLRYYAKSYEYATAVGAVNNAGLKQMVTLGAAAVGFGTISYPKTLAKSVTPVLYNHVTGAANSVQDGGGVNHASAGSQLQGSSSFAGINFTTATTGAMQVYMHYAADTGW